LCFSCLAWFTVTEEDEFNTMEAENTLVGELNYDFGIAEDEARKYLGAFLFPGGEGFPRRPGPCRNHDTFPA